MESSGYGGFDFGTGSRFSGRNLRRYRCSGMGVSPSTETGLRPASISAKETRELSQSELNSADSGHSELTDENILMLIEELKQARLHASYLLRESEEANRQGGNSVLYDIVLSREYQNESGQRQVSREVY